MDEEARRHNTFTFKYLTCYSKSKAADISLFLALRSTTDVGFIASLVATTLAEMAEFVLPILLPMFQDQSSAKEDGGAGVKTAKVAPMVEQDQTTEDGKNDSAKMRESKGTMVDIDDIECPSTPTVAPVSQDDQCGTPVQDIETTSRQTFTTTDQQTPTSHSSPASASECSLDIPKTKNVNTQSNKSNGNTTQKSNPWLKISRTRIKRNIETVAHTKEVQLSFGFTQENHLHIEINRTAAVARIAGFLNALIRIVCLGSREAVEQISEHSPGLVRIFWGDRSQLKLMSLEVLVSR
jgi:hypothetical protein